MKDTVYKIYVVVFTALLLGVYIACVSAVSSSVMLFADSEVSSLWDTMSAADNMLLEAYLQETDVGSGVLWHLLETQSQYFTEVYAVSGNHSVSSSVESIQNKCLQDMSKSYTIWVRKNKQNEYILYVR